MDDELEKLQTEVTRALQGLSSRETQLTPLKNPEKWSIQQIVEHLLLSYRATIPVFEERLRKGRPTRARPTLRQRLAQWLILAAGRFPYSRNAPALVTPTRLTSLQSGQELQDRVTADLRVMRGVLGRGETTFGIERAASHMVLGPLSVAQWKKFHLIHGRHHLKQIAAIRQQHGLLR